MCAASRKNPIRSGQHTMSAINDDFKHRLMLSAACVIMTLCPGFMNAQTTTYTYTGTLFNKYQLAVMCPLICNVSGSITLSNPIPPNSNWASWVYTPLSFSYTDGYSTITNLNENTSLSSIALSTDSQGKIYNWYIALYGPSAPLTFNGVTSTTVFIETNPSASPIMDQSGYNAGIYDQGYASGLPTGTWTCSPSCGTPVPTLTVAPNAKCGKTPSGQTSCPSAPPQATCDTTNPNTPCSPNILFADGKQTSNLYVKVKPAKSVGVSLSLATPAFGSVTPLIQTNRSGQATAAYTAGISSLGEDTVQGAISLTQFPALAEMFNYSGFYFNQSQVDNATFVNFADLNTEAVQLFFDNVIPGGDFLSKFYFDDATVTAGWYNPSAAGSTSDKYATTDTKYCPTSLSCPAVGDTGTSAAMVIANIATQYGINPKLLLVKLQKEQSLINKTRVPTAATLNYATGCSPRSTFLGQLECAAHTFINKFNLDPTPSSPYFWPINSSSVAKSVQFAYSNTTPCVDGKLISGCVSVGFAVNNAATFAQYKYTPFMDTLPAGTGGVELFETIWGRYESNGWYQ
jgi:hypothetical protein